MKVFILLALFCATAYGQSGCAGGIADCGSCRNPELECTTCLDRWWWKDLTTCLRCPDHCDTCLDSNNDDKTECTACDDYYYKTSESQCHWCNGHCKDCTGDFQCTTCGDGYRLEEKDSIACLDCSEGCRHCLDSSSSSCVDCFNGYYYSSITDDRGRCIACGSRCKKCTSGTSCDLCQSGYTWTGSSCVSCIVNCDVNFCMTNGACTKCISGFFLTTSAHQCRTCDHCLDCPDVGGCVTCEDGYILNSDGTCLPCPNVDDVLTCPSCASADRGRFFTNTFCDYCPLNCDVCSSNILCSTCKTGYYVDNGACSKCDSSCLTCSGPNADNCDTCRPGFGKNSNKCTDCPTVTGTPGCKLCVGTSCRCSTCECEVNFFKSDTPTNDAAECRSCGAFQPTDSENTCTQCAPSNRGRFMSSDKCVACNGFGDECLTCDSAKCTSCKDGWYFDASTKKCAECDDNTNCKHCKTTDKAFCTECNDKFWSSNGKCIGCPTGCSVCKNSFTCETCVDDKFKLYMELCPKCKLTNCKTCVTIDVCSECLPGFGKVGNPVTECKACTKSHCTDCNADPNTCNGCGGGYTLVSGNCEKCNVADCKVCDTNNAMDLPPGTHRDIECDTCDEKKYPKPIDVCHQCHETCLTCSAANDASKCILCQPNHHDSMAGTADSVCSPCHDTCNGCMDATAAADKCTACQSGLALSMAGTCLKCDASCATCAMANAAAQCETCPVGFGLMTGQAPSTCAACDPSCHTCAQSGMAAKCITCTGEKGLATAATAGGTCAGACAASCSFCAQETDAAMCTVCKTPGQYILDDAAIGTCGVCDTSCATCVDGTASMCKTCKDGDGLTSGSSPSTCAACDSSCATCSKAADPAKCLTCKSGKSHSYGGGVDGTCMDTCTDSTLSNCGTCDPATGCTVCDTGYAKIAAKRCTDCGSYCAACTSPTVCTTCLDGYFKTGNTCGTSVCVANCKVCLSANTCTTCLDGFIVSGDKKSCLPCADKCTTCVATTLNLCTACDPGYSDQEICEACMDTNCKVCSDKTTCTQCKDKYYKTTTNTCAACSETNCKTCPNDFCSACLDGNKLVGSSCTAKDGEGLSNCLNANSGVCVECKTGFFLDPTTNLCVACSSVSPNDAKYSCVACKGQTNHQTYQDWLATCEDCPLNCVSCSATTCFKCVDGMYTDGKACFSLSCTLSAIIHSAACGMCSTTNFNSNDEKRGLFWESSTTTCKECPRNCKVCSTTTSCDTCIDSFVWNAAQAACVECDFSVDTKCVGCASSTQGRFLDSTSKCLLCDEFCTRCSQTSSTCTACASTHYLSGSTCVSCTSSEITAEGCASCQSTYASWKTNVHAWLTKPATGGGEPTPGCFECPTNCAACSEINTCTQCFTARYFFSDAETNVYECKQCLTNCGSCSTAETCDKCLTNYYYKSVGGSNTCEKCPSHCTECTHEEGCTACASDYYLDADKTCKPCNAISNCARCVLTGENVQCTTCLATFYPKELNGAVGGECAPCIKNCNKCTGDKGCIECITDACYDEAEQECRLNAGKQCDLCELRNNVVSCKTCGDGDYLNMCQACKDARCTSCDDANDACTACIDGAFLENAACSSCASGCLSCTDAVSCSKCRDGTYWDSTTTACLPCLSKCAECNNGDSCITCAVESSFKDTSSVPNACVDCLAGCYNCTNAETCTTCHASFYPTEVNGAITACTTCGTGCGSCTENAGVVTCDECITGYTLIAGICQACSSFTNCIDCEDKNNNGVIDTGDCKMCKEGTVMSDDDSQCLACSIQGCSLCRDRDYICESCNGNKLPTPDEHKCGDQCWHCADDDECSTAPSLNGTTPKAGSKYRAVGCPNGCAIVRNETSDGIVYFRSCLDPAKVCDNYLSEQCDFYGEDENKVTECTKCCKDALCNTEELTGQNAGAEKIIAGVTAILLTLSVYLLFELT